MKHHPTPIPQNALRNNLAFSILAIIGLLSSIIVTASGQSATDGKTPLALGPGAPGGSYALSDLDHINLFNGNINLSLALLGIGGRGEAGYTVNLPIEQKWRVEQFVDSFSQQHNYPDANWWGGLKPGYGPGVMQGRKGGDSVQQCGYEPYDDYFYNTLTRLTFTNGEGTEYELRDAATNGRPATTASPGPGCVITDYNRGKIFVTADGSAATFVSDEDIFDDAVIINGSNSGLLYPSGYLMLRNGMRYRIDLGTVTWMRDRNGNRMNFSYDSFSRVNTITDSLNRQVTISYANLTTTFYDQVTFKGTNGASRTLKIWYADLSIVLRSGSGYSIQTYRQLFPQLNSSSSSNYNPKVISEVELPDSRRYRVYYNPYGEPARIELPTGGAFEYDYAAGIPGEMAYNFLTASWSEAISGVTGGTNIYRRVIEKRVYPDGSTLEGKTTFSRPESYNSGTVSYDNLGYVIVDKRNPTGTLLVRTKHYYHGGARLSLFTGATSYPSWKEGREYQTETFDTNGTTVKQRQLTTFEQRAPVSWWTWTADSAPPNDPRPTEVTTTLVDTNQVSKQTFGYDDTVPYNNQNNVKEYAFGSGAPGALLRETRRAFITASNYTGTNVHLRSLQSQVSVWDSGGVERARTTFEHDNYSTAAPHAALLTRSTVSGFDAAFTASYATRGNVTGVTNYLLTNGTVSGSVAGYAQYDILGNAVRSIDARGDATNFAFADCFGAPNGNARLNSQPLELSSVGQAGYAFVTNVTNQLSQTSYAQFDYYTGRAVDAEDINGIVSSSYSDSELLDRPTKVIRAVNTTAQSQTVFAYDDANRIVTTSSDLTTFGDSALISKTLYDGLGRTTESRQYEGGANYIATQTQYDALGRPFKASNPFRPWQSESAIWTTQAFDVLGRVVSVTTPDNAVVSTSYSGNSVTVTDQAGKMRKSITDALGRLAEVYEDPEVPGGPAELNYQTTYTYDVLDGLVKVTQGSQQRFFMYDSLKRLIRARNPEQSTNSSLNLSDPLTGNSAWSMSYQYDANSNLTQKTDARGVISTYAYDSLNRNTTIDYSDTSSINPDVKWFYDGATNGKGRFWYFYKGGDFSTGSNVEHTSTDSYDALGRPLVQRQLYKLNGAWSPAYQTSRSYNLLGSVTAQTYPSGRTVAYTYDAAGRTSSFTGHLGDGTNRTYSNSITYSPFGGVSREQFGANTTLYHKLLYNIRGQLFDTRLSSVNDLWDWNRGRLIRYYSSNHLWGQSGTDNNGNVRFAETWIPPANATLDQTQMLIEQAYSYDALNRLSSVTEHKQEAPNFVWQQQFQQAYSYDRWGNRNINAAQTWGTGINNKVFAIDAATNRLGVPVGQPGVMSYDNAGNLTTDTYTGVGNRTHDAENKMLTASDNTGQTSRYTYNADGQRTRRQVSGGQELWQIYGIDGDLLAEYRASSPASSPEKEYGYRNGQLLVTATGRFNVALAANGAIATASSTHTCCGFSTTGAINGNNRGPWGGGEGWNDATESVVPDWIQVDFAGDKTIDEINVFSLHDNYTVENTPTETQTFSLYGLLAFDVQYWNGSSWVTVTGGSVSGNNKVWRKFTFSAVTTGKIRVFINTVPDAWSRVVEIQAFGTSAGGEKVQWLVPDHLGTPRMVLDQTGSLAGVKRHDYLPFGEELFAGTGGRTTALGYAGDGVRQQFTRQERDIETGLDYFLARYYSSTQGRFTSVDPLNESAVGLVPQSWNRYTYCLNNPLLYTDPTGMVWVKDTSTNIIWIPHDQWDAASQAKDKNGNPLYRILTPEEMEYDSTTGQRVKLDPFGPSKNNPLGYTFVGPNKGSGAGALLAGAALTSQVDSPAPGPGDLAAIGMGLTALYIYLNHEVLLTPLIFNKENDSSKGDPPSTPTPHDQEKAQEAASGDSSRQVGDPARTVREGQTFIDAITGHRVHVRGNKVVVTDVTTGQRITRFKNTRKNTQNRIDSGRWIPE